MTIDHCILQKWLSSPISLSGTVSSPVVESCLTDRTQYVSISGEKYCLLNLAYGVQQGSVLGPVIYTLPIGDIIREVNVIHLDVDDIQLYI